MAAPSGAQVSLEKVLLLQNYWYSDHTKPANGNVSIVVFLGFQASLRFHIESPFILLLPKSFCRWCSALCFNMETGLTSSVHFESLTAPYENAWLVGIWAGGQETSCVT